MSGSIRRERLPEALDFIANVVDDLELSPDKTRVALVYYSDVAYLLFDYARFSSKDDIFYWIKRTPYIGGRTNSAAALRLMVYNTIQYNNNICSAIYEASRSADRN